MNNTQDIIAAFCRALADPDAIQAARRFTSGTCGTNRCTDHDRPASYGARGSRTTTPSPPAATSRHAAATSSSVLRTGK